MNKFYKTIAISSSSYSGREQERYIVDGYKGSGRNYFPVTALVMFQHDTTIGNSTSMGIEIVLIGMASFERKEVYIFFGSIALNGVICDFLKYPEYCKKEDAFRTHFLSKRKCSSILTLRKLYISSVTFWYF